MPPGPPALDTRYQPRSTAVTHACRKLTFYQLVFIDGKTIREACDALGISMSAGDNWYQKMLTVRKRIDHKCPCGKELRHRGACRFRQEYLMPKDKAPDENRTADCRKVGSARTG